MVSAAERKKLNEEIDKLGIINLPKIDDNMDDGKVSVISVAVSAVKELSEKMPFEKLAAVHDKVESWWSSPEGRSKTWIEKIPADVMKKFYDDVGLPFNRYDDAKMDDYVYEVIHEVKKAYGRHRYIEIVFDNYPYEIYIEYGTDIDNIKININEIKDGKLKQLLLDAMDFYNSKIDKNGRFTLRTKKELFIIK